MVELTNVYSESDLFTYFQQLRLFKSKELNEKKVEDTKNISEEKKTFKGTLKNIGNFFKRKTNDYSGKETKIDNDIASFNEKHPSVISEQEAQEIVNTMFNDETYGLTKLTFACTVILDSEYDYKYESQGLAAVSEILYGNSNELSIIKNQLEENYNAISPTALSAKQKGALMGVAAASLVGVICLPALIGIKGPLTAAGAAALFVPHGLGKIGVVAAEAALVGAAFTGAAYGGMKLYNNAEIKKEFKNLSPEKNALNLAIQATHIQRLKKELDEEEFKAQLDQLLRNLNQFKSDLDFYLFVEKESTKENKQKIKSFHDFDNRLMKLLNL